MCTTLSRTAIYLQQVNLMETSLVFTQIFECLHENLSPIGWKPSLCDFTHTCIGVIPSRTKSISKISLQFYGLHGPLHLWRECIFPIPMSIICKHGRLYTGIHNEHAFSHSIGLIQLDCPLKICPLHGCHPPSPLAGTQCAVSLGLAWGSQLIKMKHWNSSPPKTNIHPSTESKIKAKNRALCSSFPRLQFLLSEELWRPCQEIYSNVISCALLPFGKPPL